MSVPPLTVHASLDKDIGHLVKIKGMVTRSSDVKPQITVCTYTCEMCGSEIFQDVRLTPLASLLIT